MLKFYKLMILILLLGSPFPGYCMDNLFYILHTHAKKHDPNVETLKKHYQSIDILVAQSYQIDHHGNVTGKVDKEILSFTKLHHMKLMPLVTNRLFAGEKTHLFLKDKKAQQKSIQVLLRECNEHHFYGLQIDFENISIQDKNNLTDYYRKIATALHQHGYHVSFSVVPTVADNPKHSAYLQRVYKNWAGAYDLKALSTFSDFISIMAYDQHSEGTPPGPAASYQWMEEVVKHASHYLPANKISLGIPSYSQHWYMAETLDHHKRLVVKRDQLSYDIAQSLAKKANAKLHWDNTQKIKYAFYERHWLNEYLYIEDADSFKSKLMLVEKYQLRGISVFTLGFEDPRMWRVLEQFQG